MLLLLVWLLAALVALRAALVAAPNPNSLSTWDGLRGPCAAADSPCVTCPIGQPASVCGGPVPIWASEVPQQYYCPYQGVTCNAQQEVVGVDLTGLGLTFQALPVHMGLLRSLQTLREYTRHFHTMSHMEFGDIMQ
jgi:hypothetical protein